VREILEICRVRGEQTGIVCGRLDVGVKREGKREREPKEKRKKPLKPKIDEKRRDGKKEAEIQKTQKKNTAREGEKL